MSNNQLERVSEQGDLENQVGFHEHENSVDETSTRIGREKTGEE